MHRFKITFLLTVFGEGTLKRTFYVTAASEAEATRFAKSALTLLEGRAVTPDDITRVHEITMDQAILEVLTSDDEDDA